MVGKASDNAEAAVDYSIDVSVRLANQGRAHMDDPDYRLNVRIAGNTLIPCLQAIVAKGYAVTHYFLGSKPGDWDRPQWDAEKDGRRFSATCVEELLGLIAMWEVRGDDWRHRTGEGELYDRLVDAAPMYDPEGNVIDT